MSARQSLVILNSALFVHCLPWSVFVTNLDPFDGDVSKAADMAQMGRLGIEARAIQVPFCDVGMEIGSLFSSATSYAFSMWFLFLLNI
jgi:hypothetical protein